MAEVNLTPELRFPEFQDNWNEKRIGNLGEFIGGGTPDSHKKEYWEGEIPWISSSDINEDSIHLINKTRFITEDAIKQSATKKVPQGSVLMVSRVGIGKFAVADSELCTSQDFTNLVSTQNEYFLAYYFKARSKRFVRLSQGTSIKGFTIQDIKSAKFSIPRPEEQQKIASFLTAIDQRIQLLQKKKAKLEEYKKGVMQKLFSQDIRFKDEHGNDFPDWEEKRLGEVFNSKKGTGLSKSVLDSEGQFNCILYGELYTTYAEVIFEVVSKTNEEKGTLSRHGDLLVPCSTTTSAIDLANVTALNKDNVRLGGDITILRARENANNIFYAYYLSNFKKLEIAKYGQGTTIVHLYYNHFKVMTIDVPSIEEQNKIATFLTSLDDSIESIEAEIHGSIEYKKGLLQKMFV